MKTKKECFLCLHKQSLQALKLNTPTPNIQDFSTHITALLETFKDSPSPPPKLAIEVYKKIASITKNPDIYSSVKTDCILKAREITNSLQQNKPIFSSPNKELEWAIKVAGLGNVIDYGSATTFDIKQHRFDIDNLDFSKFDLEPFISKLASAKMLVYIGDNAGENIFDEILLATLKKMYADLKIFYFVRGAPIINDITFDDLLTHQECQPLFEYCEVIDSGVKSPGFIYDIASQKAQKLFDEADIILAKGMGNFECLESMKDKRLFLLFKIKCEVVATFLNIDLGKMMFKQNLQSSPKRDFK